MYDPDRIKTPMKRTNPAKGRGVDPRFVPISRDEALDTVADRMMELRKAGEPGKLMCMRGRDSPTSSDLMYGVLPKVWGTPNCYSHSAICTEAEKMGPGLTRGYFGYRDYDLERTNCLVVWGCDPLASKRMVPSTIHRFHEIIKRGTVIAVDPRLSNAAAKAQEWLPLKSGSDGALAGTMAHVLLVEGLWIREFVGDFKDGKNLFVGGQAVDEAAFAEKKTLIPAVQIVRVARALGEAAPKTAVWMSPGAAMHPRGTCSAMAVLKLYEQGGFEIDPEFRDLPDHVAVELEFLYLLSDQPNQASAVRDGAAMQAVAVHDHAQCEFYRELVEFTELFVRLEGQRQDAVTRH